MPKITFVVDHTPAGQSPDRPTYKAGETYDIEASYAEKYVRRGWARPTEEKIAQELPVVGGDPTLIVAPLVEEPVSRRFRRRLIDAPPADQGSEKPQD